MGRKHKLFWLAVIVSVVSVLVASFYHAWIVAFGVSLWSVSTLYEVSKIINNSPRWIKHSGQAEFYRLCSPAEKAVIQNAAIVGPVCSNFFWSLFVTLLIFKKLPSLLSSLIRIGHPGTLYYLSYSTCFVSICFAAVFSIMLLGLAAAFCVAGRSRSLWKQFISFDVHTKTWERWIFVPLLFVFLVGNYARVTNDGVTVRGSWFVAEKFYPWHSVQSIDKDVIKFSDQSYWDFPESYHRSEAEQFINSQIEAERGPNASGKRVHKRKTVWW